MTRDAIIEANRIIEDISKAKEFWNNHNFKGRNEPDGLVERISSTVSEYIKDMEYKLDSLPDYFEYEKNKTEGE